MKISSSFYNTNSRNNSHSFKGVPVNPVYIPEWVGTIGKYAGKYIDSPEQRLILALATLMFKPAIDLKYARDDKKIDTALKTTAKGLAGGITGVAIRGAFLKLTEKYIGYDCINNRLISKQNRLNSLFLPKISQQIKEDYPELVKLRIAKYSNTLGSLFAIAFMILFSNSNIDVPLTNDLQDLLSGVVKEKKTWLKSLGDVSSARADKIRNWFKRKMNVAEKISTKLRDIAAIIKSPDNREEPKK